MQVQTGGSYIVHRNRKRSFLSQATVRQEFVEKKYDVFDITGRLLLLVQVHPSSPLERVEKPWNFGSQQTTTTSVRRLSVVQYVLWYTKLSRVAHSCRVALVFREKSERI